MNQYKKDTGSKRATMVDEETKIETVMQSENQIKKPWLFQKGDPRINRKGRPRSFDQLRKMVQRISHEIINPNDPIEKQLTVAEGIARKLILEDPKHFFEIGFGKVPQPVELSGEGKLSISVSIDTVGSNEGNQNPVPSQPDTSKIS